MLHVTCGIIVKNDRILVAQRSELMSLPLKWEFPGGKLHNNETSQECILREIEEELNLKVKISQKLNESVYDYGNSLVINLIPFVLEYLSGELILLEHKTALWLDKKELLALDWALADIPILHEFLSL